MLNRISRNHCPDRIPRRLRRVAFHILQESLANACRHSKNHRLFVELSLDGNMLRVQVRDWGAGFDSDGAPPERSAPKGTPCRLKLIEGTATIISNPGQGTSVTAELPLVRPNGRDEYVRRPFPRAANS